MLNHEICQNIIDIGGKVNETETLGGPCGPEADRGGGEDPGGIILTSAGKEKPEIYEVVVVGPGGLVDGEEVKMEVSVGQRVIMGKYTGTNVKLDGETYTIVRQHDILAVVEE